MVDIISRKDKKCLTLSTFPRVDVSETENAIVVRANISGVDPASITVEAGDDYLSLSGHVEREGKEEKRTKVPILTE